VLSSFPSAADVAVFAAAAGGVGGDCEDDSMWPPTPPVANAVPKSQSTDLRGVWAAAKTSATRGPICAPVCAAMSFVEVVPLLGAAGL
jgi:hypothetical protein